MSFQIKLENTFKTLIETENQFGENNRFISLRVSPLTAGKSVVDGFGKIYLGILKYYNVIVNQYKTIDLFIKLEPKELKLSKYGFEQEQIVYDFKFHNEFVAYKYILPILNHSFNHLSKSHQLYGIELSSNKDIGNAYTIEEFKNDVRYREIGRPKNIQHRHSWNPSTHEERVEEKFFTIKPNSTFAVNKCKIYQQTSENMDEILNLFPKFYHGEVSDDRNEENIIVIENMLPAGFHTSDKTIFLDKDQILMTLKALGKFHASSYIAKHNSPKEFKKAVSKLKATGWTLPEYWDIYPNFLDEHLLRGINFLKTDPRYKKYVYKFDSILKNPKDYFFKILNTDDNMAVICHGDFCKNNILYHYSFISEEVSSKDVKTMNGETSPLKSTICQEDVSVKRLNSKEIKIQEEKLSSNNYTNSYENEKELNSILNPQEIMHIQTNTTLHTIDAKKSNEEIDKNHLRRSKTNSENNEILTSKLQSLKIGDINKDAVKKIHSDTIGDKRKSFLHQILETNSKENSYTIKFENQGKENECIVQSEKSVVNNGSLINETKDVSTRMYNCSENITDNRNISSNLNNDNSVNNIKETYKSITPLVLTSNKLTRQQYSENDSNNSNVGKNFDNENEENHILADRLKYLEGKYRELEKIYKVNHSVLEKKRVNMKIIEKLNEKKEILEEICRKIETINAKQEMELKLQNSMTKLYQNVHDLDFKQRWKPLVSEVKTRHPANNRDELNDGSGESQDSLSQNIEKLSSTVGKTEDITNTTTIFNKKTQTMNGLRQTVHKSICDTTSHNQTDCQSNNIEEEFNRLYEESFSKNNLNDYEKRFSELSKKIDADIQMNPDTLSTRNSVFLEKNNQKKHNKSIYRSNRALFQGIKTYKQFNINILEDSKPSSENVECDYQTLSVKQRRDNLERSISLSNGSLYEYRKGMRKSNTDWNLLKMNKPLISERNILIDNQVRDECFERETLKKELLRGQESNTRDRIFTTSSLDINLEEEFENDDVFESSKTIYETQRTKLKTPTQPQNENRDKLERSKSFVELQKSSPRPIPMKRTISLIENSKNSCSKSDIKQTEVVLEKYKPIYDGDEIEDGERIFEETNIALIGVHYIDNVDVKINQRRDPSLTGTKQPSNTETLDHREYLKRTMSPEENDAISESPRSKGKIEVNEPIIVKKSISLLGVSDCSRKTKINVKENETYHQTSSSTFPRTAKGKYLDSKTVSLKPNQMNRSNISETLGHEETLTLPRTSRGRLLDELKTVKETSPLSFRKPTKDIVFFDLARMIYSSPVIDLSFFLFLNVSHKLRNECWDEFISVYYDSLIRSVPESVKVPSRSELLKEVKKKVMYGYFLCCFFLPWMMEEQPHQEAEEWVHHGGREGTEAIANILKFLIDRDFVS